VAHNRIKTLLFCASLLFATACGKKEPPFLPQKAFSVSVVDLKGEWGEGYIFLSGKINDPVEPKEAMTVVKGCRVYYGQYPLDNPPCAGCPIKYHGYHGFGPEVITEKGFFCKVPGKRKEHIYYFEVKLVGPDGNLGPSSNRVKVSVE